MRKKLLFLAIAIIAIQTAYAGGYRVSLQGVRQTGMGHTGVSLAGDASSIFFNPGSLTAMENQWSFVVGGSGVLSKAGYKDPTDGSLDAQTNNKMSTPFNFYAGYKLNDQFALGLGVYTPYGSSVDWGNTWVGNNQITQCKLEAIYFQPTLAYQVNNWLSFGAGFIYATGSMDLSKSLDKSLPGIPAYHIPAAGLMKLTDKVNNYGFNLGLYLKPTPELSVGISYRSRIIMHAKDGDASIDISDAYIAAAATQGATLVKNDTWTSELPLPAELTLGGTYKINPRWLVSMDMTYTFWGTYKNLTFDFAKNTIGNVPTDPTVRVSGRNYQDEMTFRVGTQYQFCDKFTGRVGFYNDPTPSPSAYFSPETPTCNSNGYSVGGSYSIAKNMKIEAAYLYVDGQSRYVDATANGGMKGTFNLSANVFSLGLNFGF